MIDVDAGLWVTNIRTLRDMPVVIVVWQYIRYAIYMPLTLILSPVRPASLTDCGTELSDMSDRLLPQSYELLPMSSKILSSTLSSPSMDLPIRYASRAISATRSKLSSRASSIVVSSSVLWLGLRDEDRALAPDRAGADANDALRLLLHCGWVDIHM